MVETPLHVQTSKIAFIELLLRPTIIAKHKRTVYKNLETLGKKKVISYDHRMIRFTEQGLKELQKISKEIDQFEAIKLYFQYSGKPHRKLQTTLH